MLPVITIIGRPNVGKSTLFNKLTKTRDALVADMPGVTRDRQYGEGLVGDRPYIVVDTGGLSDPNDPIMGAMTDKQVHQAIDEADLLFFLVDAKDGLTSADEAIAAKLRVQSDKVVLLVNKADREEAGIVCGDFFSLGLGEPKAVSATMGRGIKDLMEGCLKNFPKEEVLEEKESGIRVAVIGKPNVGKSTLINCMLGEERVIVLDRPGTTRDSIYIPFERREERYTLIDTAGVRRRARVDSAIEKFSIVKTMQAIEQSHVVLMVVDAQSGLTDQDMRLLGFAVDSGKALIILINKWDGMDEYDRDQVKQAIDRRLPFVDYARRYFISALHGTGVGKIYHAIHEAYDSASRDISTSDLTRVLERATRDHQPPLVGGRRVKLRYAHVGGHHPLRIIIHGKQVDALPGSYQRYLSNYFRKAFDLKGIPVIVHFRADANPYNT